MSKLKLSKIFSGLLIVAVMAVGAVVSKTKVASAAECSITSTLRLGSKGTQVACLQTMLGNLTADGSFGPKTKAAVMAYQAANGLVADGIVGAKSRASLMANAGDGSASCPPGQFNPATGLPCPSSGGTLPAGCLPGYMFSPTTGAPCTPGTTPPPVVPTTGAVTVSLASDNPATGTLLIDDTTGVMQSAAPILKLVFSNGTGAAVNVNTVKLMRTGIAADGDINNLYLYEGATKLAEMSSVASKVFSFNSSSGLFSIPANSSKTVWVGVNMTPATTGPNTVGFSLMSASDVVYAGGLTSGGSFPINGNQFATAFITDLGNINISTVTTSNFPATLDPKQDVQELFRFTATAQSQKMNIKRIVMTMVGTIAPSDIQDLSLSVGGVQVGATAQIGTDNKVVFDWSASPYTLLSGQNKVFVLNGKVIKGTGRAFKFTIRSNADFVSTDTNYGVDTAALYNLAALNVIDPDSSGDGTNINNGSLTVSRSANSPSGNVASGGLDMPLARFDYRANGEDIKVVYVRVNVNEESSDLTLNDGKLYFNGSQVGTTDDSVADETDNVYSLGNTVIIPAGTTGVFEYRANIEQASGTDLASGQTIVVSLSAGTSGDAVGQTSLTNLTPSASTGQTLTVKTGTLSVAKNTSAADYTTANPTGVVGATNVKVASLVITAGAGEAVNLTQVVVGDDATIATNDFGGKFQNLTLRNGSSTSTPIATVQGTLSSTEGADYTFSLSPSVTIAAGAQYVVDVYADILTGATGYTGAVAESGLEFVSVTGTGVSTSADASLTTDGTTTYDLQTIVISSSGSLVITVNAATPVAAQLVMGETGQTLASLDFAAGSPEDVNVSVITITDTSSFAGSLSNVKLYDGLTLLGTVASFDANTNGVATFNLSSDWVIPKNTTKTLTIKADVNSYGSAVSGGAHVLNLASNANVTSRGSQSGADITETVTVGTISHKVYRTKVVVEKGSSSPSGSSVVAANSNVLEFTVAANSAYDAVVNAVAVTMSGSMTATGTGNAFLYKSTDLSTALATEEYRADLVSDSAAVSSQELQVTGTSGDWNEIPVGATVLVNDTSVSSTAFLRGEVAAVSATVITINVVGTISGYAGIDVGVTYAPMQPGVGKVYFGAQSQLDANLADAATTVTVESTDGFAIGDTVKVFGYDTLTGAEVSWVSGCVVSAIASATALTTSACQLTSDLTIDFDYGQTQANALVKSTNNDAVAWGGAGTDGTGAINTSGQVVSAGTTTTFVVKGDTTSTGTAGTTATLRADLAAIGDVNWDDKTSFGVTTVTKNLPVTGGTLTYTY